ncbi:MAG: rhodanese-like domain-containing protein [Rubricoccaceae bacterium]
MRKRVLWLSLGGIAVLGLAALVLRPVRWVLLQRGLEARHANVAWISTDQLAAELASDSPPTLLDVRQPDEIAVSQIPGAIPVSPEAPMDSLRQLELAGPVVVYCSVGARSATLAERLEAAGIDSVRNLRGSIFAWANEGRPLVRAGEPVETVHPYDAAWGTYLKPSLRADL